MDLLDTAIAARYAENAIRDGVGAALADDRASQQERRRPARDLWEARKARQQAWSLEQHAIRGWQHATVWPWAATAGTWVYGVCSHYVAVADHNTAATATVAGLAATGVVFVVRWGLRRVFVPQWSLRFWLAGAVAAVWATLTTVAGPSWLLAALLATVTVALSAAWYRHHRLPNPTRDVEPEPVEVLAEPEPEPLDLVQQLGALWDTYFGGPGRKFAGSIFTGGERTRNGVRAEIHLDPELHNYDMLAADAVLSAIAAMVGYLGIKRRDILIEPHPSGDHSKGVLTFLTANPLQHGVAYPGPRYHDGFVPVGPWVDGEGWGSVQLTDHNATVINGLVTGDPGMGKSVFLENLGMSALVSGCWKVLYCDGSEDADSSALLNEYMTAAEAGIEGARRQLAAVQEYLATRGEENAVLPPDIRGVNPSPARMGLLWIIDEAHRLFRIDPAFAAEVAQVVRLGRKKGVAVWTATQGVDLKDDFGNVTALRDILTSRNVVAFYSASTYAHTMISGTTIAPNKLPTDGGYAYLKAPKMTRALMLRTGYAQDMTPWARAIPIYQWDENGGLAVKRYMESRTPADAQRAEALRKFELRLHRLRNNLDTTPETADTTITLAGGFDDLRAKMPAELTAADMEPLHAVPDGTETTWDSTHHAICDLIDGGVIETGEIVVRLTATGVVSERTVKRKLAELVADGVLEHAGKQGRYQRAA